MRPAHSYPDVMHLAGLSASLRTLGTDALLVSPGPDMRYLIGYDAVPLERLTLLVAQADDDHTLVVPVLEQAEAERTPFAAAGGRIRTWTETQDPWDIVWDAVGDASRIGVDPHMWASRLLRVQQLWPSAHVTAPSVVADMRCIKGPDEVDALRAAGEAIDRVHRRIPEFLRPGRTEREVAADIADAIIAAGHVRVDFVIVASGPHGASPHHSVSDRVIGVGEPVVIDIGGTMPSGYCSDCTRVYVCGAASAEYREYYRILQDAQRSAVEAVAPGVTCEELDSVARTALTASGLGEAFVHRTGHGIGLQTHEDPYIVSGNATALRPGMAFSIEPGFYLPGHFGARIEDIVICGESGPILVNNVPRDLCVIEG